MHIIKIEQGVQANVSTEHRPSTAVNGILGHKVELAAAVLKALLDPTLDVEIETFNRNQDPSDLRVDKFQKYLSLILKLGFTVETEHGCWIIEDATPVPTPEPVKDTEAPTGDEKPPGEVEADEELENLSIGDAPPAIVPVPAPIQASTPAPTSQVPEVEPVAADPANDFVPTGTVEAIQDAQAPTPSPYAGKDQPGGSVSVIRGDAGMQVSL